MKNAILNWSFIVAAFLYIIHQSHSVTEFKCVKSSDREFPLPPSSYSADIRINFLNDGYSVEVKHIKSSRGGKDFVEFKKKDRRVKYIVRGDQEKVLIINYKDEQPTCTVTNSLDVMEFLDGEDTGPRDIISKFISVSDHPEQFYYAGEKEKNGMAVSSWEGCFKKPKINVSYSFAPNGWGQPYVSYLEQNANYIVSAYAQIGQKEMEALFFNFDPRTPDETIFQPPTDVYCEDFRTDKKLPSMKDFFSYNAEILTYEGSEGIAPLVSNRRVYYDKIDSISRMDFYDPIPENEDMFSPVRALEKSVIHDFNAGVQYDFNPVTGECSVGIIRSTSNVLYNLEDKSNVMASGKEFFLFDGSKISYNGQFPVRGMMADVFTAKRESPITKKNTVITWFFSTEQTRIVETENVEKNVLLRMSIHPETGFGKENVTEINFYNFERQQPSVTTYDLSKCFNESSFKFMVLTFPANDDLRGSEKLVAVFMHLTLKKNIGISKQRILIREVISSVQYMYVEFYFFDVPPVGNPKFKEISLDDAVTKLKNAVSKGKFSVEVSTKNLTIILKPEPNGLNVFAGDRDIKPKVIGYKEGSVIGLTIGMLLLGVLLGGVTVNLIMSKKYGISLFQKSNRDNETLSNRHGESSM